MLDTPTLVPPIFDAPNISKSLEFEIVQALTEPSINLYPSNKRKIYGVHETLPYFVVSGSVALNRQYTILGTCSFREETFSIVQLGILNGTKKNNKVVELFGQSIQGTQGEIRQQVAELV